MSNLLLADLTNATRTEITRKLPDVVSSKKNTLGILVGSQVLRTKKTGNAPFDILRSNDLAAGEAFQVDFQVGFPVAVGAKAITGSMASLKLPQQANFNVVSGKITPSYYQLREDIRTAQVERVKKSPKVLGPNLASKISQSAITGFMKRWNDDLFPDAGCIPCYAAGVNGISSGSWGWVQTKGNMTIQVLSTASASSWLYTTGTAGALDDTSTSQVKITGITLNANATTVGSYAAFAGVEMFAQL